MAVTSANFPSVQNLPSFARNPKGAESEETAGPFKSFGDVLKATVENNHQNWVETEAKMRDAILGNVDSETVIPMIAQTAREIETVVALTEKSTGALVKILDTNI